MSKVVVCFGRMNPPTWGHQKIIEAVMNEALLPKAEHRIVLSGSQDAYSNPLTWEQKAEFIQWEIPEAKILLIPKPTLFHVLADLNKEYDELTFVCGHDRYTHMKELITKYNHVDYDWKSLSFVDVPRLGGISGTRMRFLAENGNFEEFREGCMLRTRNNLEKSMALFKDVQLGLQHEYIGVRDYVL
jgi:hypothetical protein